MNGEQDSCSPRLSGNPRKPLMPLVLPAPKAARRCRMNRDSNDMRVPRLAGEFRPLRSAGKAGPAAARRVMASDERFKEQSRREATRDKYNLDYIESQLRF
jgi:hypothetical protein